MTPAEERRNPAAPTRYSGFFTNGRDQPLRVRLVCATFWTAIAAGLRFLLQPAIGERLSFDFPVVFVLIVAWSTGAWPALLALAVSFVATLLLFPLHAGVASRPAFAMWELAHFLAPALVGIFLIESLHRIRRRMAHQKAELDREVKLHRQAEKELAAAREELKNYAEGLETAVRVRTSELHETQQFQRNFFYAIAHDLRAPVRAILGFTGILTKKQDERLTDADKDVLDRTQQAALRLDRLVNGLIELGRVASASLAFQQVDLDRVVATVLANLKPALGGASPVIVEAPLGSAWTDLKMVECVLSELIENAIRFARPGVPLRIHIRTMTASDVVTLCVCDNGVGIPKVYQKKIFGCFQTLHKHDAQHPGVGLAIVAEAANRMHAVVRLESDPGVGACFQIDLPRRPPVQPILVDSQMPVKATPLGDSTRIPSQRENRGIRQERTSIPTDHGHGKNG